MRNEYVTTEVVEIGAAQEVILGEKIGPELDESQVFPATSLDLDE